MPFRHFECPNSHITETVDYPKSAGKTTYTLAEVLESQKNSKPRTTLCKECGLVAQEVFISIKEARDAKRFSPTLLYKHPDGRVIVPGRNDPNQLPKRYRNKLAKQGFEQVEISNFRQYQSFQQEQRALLKDQQDQHITQQQAIYNQTIREQIEAFRRGDPVEMPIVDDSGRVVGSKIIQQRLDDLSPGMRQLADLAIERALNYRIQGGSSDPYIESMEFDNTKWRDKDSGWRERS